MLMILGALGILDTVFISTISSPNLGVLLPGILGLPLLLWGLFLPLLTRLLPAGWFAALKWLSIAFYSLALLCFSITWLIIDHAANNEAPKDLDVVIVLGAGLRGENPTRVLRQRLDTCIQYLQDNPHTIAILSGGQGSGETISEAEAMARYLAAHDISAQRYLLETQSSSTKENFTFSYRMITDTLGSDARIGFITTDFHIYRAGRVAAKQGMQTHGIPAQDSWYIVINNHLRECMAVWGYALRGDI